MTEFQRELRNELAGMSDRDAMIKALASALPSDNIKAYDDRGQPISIEMLAAVVAAELQDQGYRLVRP